MACSHSVMWTVIPRAGRPMLARSACSSRTRTITNLRRYATKNDASTPDGDVATGPNMQQQEHVSEEAAKYAKITGGEGPDLSQGTPVQDILKKDQKAQDSAPQVMKDSIRNNRPAPKPNTRPFSTLARRMQDMNMSSTASASTSRLPPSMMTMAGAHFLPIIQPTPTDRVVPPATEVETASKLPVVTANMKKNKRYDPIVDQFTKLIMRDGRLAVAQRIVSNIMQHLRTSSPPTYAPDRVLAPGTPPASYLPLSPVTYLTVAIDSIAPLLRMKSLRGAAGGGQALQIPAPLTERQRRRTAITWILEAAESKPSRGSGKAAWGLGIAEEIVAVVEGRSSLWEKKAILYKLATTARVNVGHRSRRSR